MKWLLLILPMFLKRFASFGGSTIHPIEEIKDFIKANALKMLLAFTAAYAIGALFVAGIVLTVINFTAQYDAGLQPRITGLMAGGLAMSLTTVIIFAIGIYYATSNVREAKKEERVKQNQPHPIEEALMLLVNDFIREREFKRTRTEAAPRFNNEDEDEIHTHFKSNEQFERH